MAKKKTLEGLTPEELERARAKQREYAREYRRTHPGYNAAVCARYWLRKAEQDAAQAAQEQEQDTEKKV